MRSPRKYGLIVALSLCACRASEPEAIGHVEQATIEDRAADEVFGQVDLFSRAIPTTPSSTTLQRPLAVATDTLFRPGANIYYIVDSDAHRVLAVNPGSGFASWVIGQSSASGGLPNAGSTAVNNQGFYGPTAVAAGGGSASGGLLYLVVADTSNNRVLYGSGFFSMPWGATGVFGQRGSFSTNLPNIGGIDENTLSAPQGVAIDGDPLVPSRIPRIYVSDTGNNRVLVYDLGAGSSSATNIYGQETYDASSPNRGGSAGKNTLSGPTGIAVYNGTDLVGLSLHGVYVADTGNNRVLFFRQFEPNALRVYGQIGDFTSTTPNKGGISSSTLSKPTGVAVDPNGGLYIADTGNHRVLHYPPGGTVADQVFGQPTTTSAVIADPSPTTLHGPTGVAVTANGDLLIADAGNVRVLRYVKGCGPSCDDGDPCTNDFCNPTAGCVHQVTTYSTECSPYRCDAVKHECLPSCMSAGDCDPSAHAQCRNTVCVSTCGSPAECKTGNCVDGFCCDKACDGPCESCGKPGFEGTCIPVPAGPPEPTRVCPVTIEGECGTRCDGVQGKTCRAASPGSACGVESCVDGKQRTRGTCDGAGKCVTEIVTCAPYACGSGGCRTSCAFDYECVGSARCVDGRCVTGFGAESAGGGCAFGRGKETASLFGLMLSLCALASRRRR